MLVVSALAVTLFLSPALFTGRLLSPADSLFAYLPWSSARPEGWSAGSNPTQLDSILQFEPWMQYSARRLWSGSLPLWNPDNMLGAPFAGNVQSGVFFPLNWIFFLLPDAHMLAVRAWVQLLLAALGMYLLARQVAYTGPLGAFIAMLTYAFGASMIGWLLWPHASVMLWLPWLWWATGRLIQSPRPGRVALLALFVALSILAGQPEAAYEFALATALFALFYATLGLPAPARQTAVRLGLWCIAYALGALVAAIQILPFIEYVRESAVLLWRGNPGRTPAFLPLSYTWTLFSPDFFGNPARHNVWHASPIYNESNTYSGLAPLLLAPFAALLPKGTQRRFALFLAMLGVLAMGTSYHWPFIYDAITNLPLVRFMATRRMIFLLPLVFGLLGALGAEELARRLPRRHTLAWLSLFAAGLVVLGMVVPWAFAHSFFEVPLTSDQANDVWRSSIFRIGVVLVLLFVLLAAAIGLGRARPRAARMLLAFLPLLLFLDLFQARFDYNATIAPGDYFPDTGLTRSLQRQPAPNRFLASGSILMQNTNLHYGLSDMRGYDAVEPRLFRDISLLIDPQISEVAGGRWTSFDNMRSPLLNLLGVRYVVTPPDDNPNYQPDVGNDMNGGQIVGEIAGNNRPGQTFRANLDNLAQIQLLGATFGGKATGRIVFHLKTSPTALTDIAREELTVSHLADNGWWQISFPPINDSKGRSLYFYLERPGAEPGSAPTVWYNPNDVYPGGERTSNGAPANGDLVFRTGSLTDPDNPRFLPVATGDPAGPLLFENKRALPRAWLVHAAEVITSSDMRLKRLSEPSFDPAYAAILNEPLPQTMPLPLTQPLESGSATITSYEPENVAISTTSTAPALVVLADQAFPGWVATVDGRRSPVLTADHALRAVYVPEGTHTVRFSYEPDSFRLGVLISVSGGLLMITLAVWEYITRRKEIK